MKHLVNEITKIFAYLRDKQMLHIQHRLTTENNDKHVSLHCDRLMFDVALRYSLGKA